MREFVDKDDDDIEYIEYYSLRMFNMAYYLTTVIVNSEEPEQYLDEYLGRAEIKYGYSVYGKGIPKEIRSVCTAIYSFRTNHERIAADAA